MSKSRGATICLLAILGLAAPGLVACSSDPDYLDNPVDAVYPAEYVTVLNIRPITLGDANIVDRTFGWDNGLQYTVVRRDGRTLIVEQAKTGVDDLIHPFDRAVLQQTHDSQFHVLPTFQVKP